MIAQLFERLKALNNCVINFLLTFLVSSNLHCNHLHLNFLNRFLPFYKHFKYVYLFKIQILNLEKFRWAPPPKKNFFSFVFLSFFFFLFFCFFFLISFLPTTNTTNNIYSFLSLITFFYLILLTLFIFFLSCYDGRVD